MQPTFVVELYSYVAQSEEVEVGFESVFVTFGSTTTVPEHVLVASQVTSFCTFEAVRYEDVSAGSKVMVFLLKIALFEEIIPEIVVPSVAAVPVDVLANCPPPTTGKQLTKDKLLLTVLMDAMSAAERPQFAVSGNVGS